MINKRLLGCKIFLTVKAALKIGAQSNLQFKAYQSKASKMFMQIAQIKL